MKYTIEIDAVKSFIEDADQDQIKEIRKALKWRSENLAQVMKNNVYIGETVKINHHTIPSNYQWVVEKINPKTIGVKSTVGSRRLRVHPSLIVKIEKELA